SGTAKEMPSTARTMPPRAPVSSASSRAGKCTDRPSTSRRAVTGMPSDPIAGAVGPEDTAQAIGDLAQRRPRLDRRDQPRHEVLASARGRLDGRERRGGRGAVARRAETRHPEALRRLEARVDAMQRHLRARLGEAVDADDDPLAALQFLLDAVGRLLNFA